MHRGTVLIVGLACLAALVLFAAMIFAPRIESDIGGRTAQVLASAGKDFVEISVDGRDVTVTGAAPSDADREDVVGLAHELWGVRLVRDEMTVLDPPVSPFTFSATVSEDSVSLKGFVPDEATKSALAERAAAIGKPVNDETIIARGVPDQAWGDAVAAGLEQLAGLGDGELIVEDTTLSLTGSLTSEEEAAALESALIAGLPASYAFQPAFDVPPPIIVDEPAPIGADTPSDGGATASSSDTAGAAGDGAAATGESDTADGAAALLDSLGSPEECQAEFDTILTQRAIQFSSASAVISVDSYDLLNELGEISGRCSGALIAIEGHTDSTGPLQGNIDLSLARAEAVMEYLVGLGIDRARLSAFGYGPTLPVASNDTEEGRAQNRRIEFKVER